MSLVGYVKSPVRHHAKNLAATLNTLEMDWKRTTSTRCASQAVSCPLHKRSLFVWIRESSVRLPDKNLAATLTTGTWAKQLVQKFEIRFPCRIHLDEVYEGLSLHTWPLVTSSFVSSSSSFFLFSTSTFSTFVKNVCQQLGQWGKNTFVVCLWHPDKNLAATFNTGKVTTSTCSKVRNKIFLNTSRRSV